MLRRYFILTIILRVIVVYAIKIRVPPIERVDINGSATSRGNLWIESWALRSLRRRKLSMIFFSIACMVHCHLPDWYSKISAYLASMVLRLHHRDCHLQHIIKRPFKANQSNCSLILLELSLCELVILLVDLLFELR